MFAVLIKFLMTYYNSKQTAFSSYFMGTREFYMSTLGVERAVLQEKIVN